MTSSGVAEDLVEEVATLWMVPKVMMRVDDWQRRLDRLFGDLSQPRIGGQGLLLVGCHRIQSLPQKSRKSPMPGVGRANSRLGCERVAQAGNSGRASVRGMRRENGSGRTATASAS